MKPSALWKALAASVVAVSIAACGDGPAPTSTGAPGTVAKPPIRWGGDESGGAPYEFRDPKAPENRIGCEVEIADEISSRTGRKVEFVQALWETLVPGLRRGDFDMAMAAIEVTDERKAEVEFARPYYIYTQQLAVRAEENAIKALADCKGRKVGTLNASAAERILKKTDGVEVVGYDDNTRPYEDLALGRVDAVLLDLPIAVYYAKPNPKLKFVGEPFAPGEYAMAFRKGDPLRAEVDKVVADMISDGTLKRIYTKWGLWNDAQAGLK